MKKLFLVLFFVPLINFSQVDTDGDGINDDVDNYKKLLI